MTEKYANTQISVTIVLANGVTSMLCAGIYAPLITTTAPVMAPPCRQTVLSSAAPHQTITAAMNMIGMNMVMQVKILSAQAAHLPTSLTSAKTITKRIPQGVGVTTPSNTANT